MANKVTIDVEARFIDNVTDEAKAAAKAFTDVEKAAEEAKKDVDKLGKTKVNMDADRAAKKLDDLDRKLNKIGRSKTEAKLSVMDKASAIIDKVTSKAKAFASKTYSGLVKLRDSNVLGTLNKMSNGLKSLTSKAWSVAVKIKDTFTAPLTKLKNMLFNVKTLIAGIASAWAATKLIINPINVADAYSSAKIGFSTLLGETGGQKMMDDLDAFAKATPFKTTGVIANAQKMMAMGWDTDTLLEDLEVIGNAAAATGKLDQGLESIVRAMSQIKTKGKLSTEELNQLAEAGIAAKAMLAEGLGYGTGDKGIAAMTEDLEKGAIQSDIAIQALIAGMRKYDGMMDSMANETVEGLISQMQDVFEINIVRKWGQGLQDGAKKGFGTVIELLDESEEALSKFGDMLYDIGHTASNWVANKLQGLLDKILSITDTYEFKNASLKEKISMIWKTAIADPFSEWFNKLWTSEENIEKATNFGKTLAEKLTQGILAVLGLTDILKEGGLNEEKGANIAEGFARGFVDGFDVSAITDKLVEAIGNVWKALPAWARFLIAGYAVGKMAGGIANFAGGIAKFIGTAATAGVGDVIVAGSGLRGLIGGNVVNAAGDVIGATGLRGLIGSTGNYMVSGTGALGKLASTGYALTGSAGAGMSGGTAALVGGGSIAGGIAAAATIIKGGIDLYKGYTTDDEVEAKARKTSGYTALAGVGAGAAIGTMILPGVGTLIGAGIGGIAGWIGGDAWADKIRETDDYINDVSAATADLGSEQEKLEVKAKMVWQNMRDHFGDIKLSLSEIQALTKNIVWGDDLVNYEQFTTAAQTAEANLTSLKSAAETTNRWMWKASLGMKFSKDEIESIASSFDEYITAAINHAENKHYEFTAAVSLLVDAESEAGKSILGSGNAFYTGIQEQLNSLGTELSEKVKIYLQGGVLELKEPDEIINLQKQIAEITQQLADAETDAELELIHVKFGKGRMDLESFDSFMEQIEITLNERIAANDEAFTASVAALNLELAKGAIKEDQYKEQLQALVDGYTSNVDSLKARIMDVELKIIGDAYGISTEKLSEALQASIAEGVDPIDWTYDMTRELLGIDDLSESSADAISQMLSAVASQLELVEVDGKILMDLGYEVEGGQNEAVEIINSHIPDTVEDDVTVALNAYAEVTNNLSAMSEAIINGHVPDTVKDYVTVELNAYAEVTNRLNMIAEDFGIQDRYTFSPTVNINAKTGKVILPTLSLSLSQGGRYRGGIVGGDSAMDAFARGGMTDNSGIVGGSTRLIRVNEESPEMIIPLSDQRRGRALKLWAQAGNIMGVPGFARGGIIGGNNTDEGFRFSTYGGNDSTGGRTVQVNMGGVKLEINVSGSDREGIVEAIKAQAGELADYFVGLIADALETEFENTPVRGGST